MEWEEESITRSLFLAVFIERQTQKQIPFSPHKAEPLSRSALCGLISSLMEGNVQIIQYLLDEFVWLIDNARLMGDSIILPSLDFHRLTAVHPKRNIRTKWAIKRIGFPILLWEQMRRRMGTRNVTQCPH